MGARGSVLLTRFYISLFDISPVSDFGIIIRKIFALIFINISNRLTEIFSKKLDLDTEVFTFGCVLSHF